MKSKDHLTDQLASRTEIEEVLAGDVRLSKELKALSPKARAYVLALVELGGATNESHRAAQIAGFSGGKATLQVTASRLAADERVQHALVEEAKRMARSASLEAVCVTIEIMQGNGGATPTARLAAATRIGTLAGLEPPKQVDVHTAIEITVTKAQQIRRVKELATELGIDPKKLLGVAGVVVDAEFTEVPAAPIGDTTGLEDIL